MYVWAQYLQGRLEEGGRLLGERFGGLAFFFYVRAYQGF
jgi:hypothetical protein